MGNFNLDTDEQKEWYNISTNRSSEHLGDCLELMPLIADESIDMILCDLPYGTIACKWDVILPFDKLWEQYERIIKPNGVIILTASQPFTTVLINSNFKLFKYCWYWKKSKPNGWQHSKNRPMTAIEECCVFSKAPMGHVSLLGDKRMIYNPQGITSIGNKTISKFCIILKQIKGHTIFNMKIIKQKINDGIIIKKESLLGIFGMIYQL